jgi:hypothetical protein
MQNVLAQIAHVSSWLAPALILLALLATSGLARRSLSLAPWHGQALWAAAAVTSLFNLIYFVVL